MARDFALVHRRVLMWQTERLRPPVADYFAAEDHLTTWLDEACSIDPNVWKTTERLFAAWKTWAINAGIAAGELQGNIWVSDAHGAKGIAVLCPVSGGAGRSSKECLAEPSWRSPT